MAGQPRRMPERGAGICQPSGTKCWQAAPRAPARFGVFENLKLRIALVSRGPPPRDTCAWPPPLHTCANPASPAEPWPSARECVSSQFRAWGPLPQGFQRGGRTGTRAVPNAPHTWPGTPGPAHPPPASSGPQRGGPLHPLLGSRLQSELFPACWEGGLK